MNEPPAGLSKLESTAFANPTVLRRCFAISGPRRESHIRALLADWRVCARPAQLPPDGDWRTWVLLGGRGAGKTRAGAEWIREQVMNGNASRIALAGPSLHDVREVMIEGESGLRHLPGEAPVYEVTRRRLLWPNGAQAQVISAMDADNFRGPQFDAVWADELCVWPHLEATLSTLRLGLRLGERPRLVVTTTPKPVKALRDLIAEPRAVVSRMGTQSNRANLALGFFEDMAARYGDSAYGRQELDGELLDQPEGALWDRALIEACCVKEWPAPDEFIVAVDPAVSSGSGANKCGIVVAGAYGANPRRAVVLADESVQGLSPNAWMAKVVALAQGYGAVVVAEANNGGELVRDMLHKLDPNVPVSLVYAKQGKRERAQNVRFDYGAGNVSHGARFRELEDEMCTFGAPGFVGSPDRLDALVWAVRSLLNGRPEPRLRGL